MIKKAVRLIGLVALMAIFYVLAVAGNEKKDKLSDWTVRDGEPMEAIGEIQSRDIGVLARAFGAQMPYRSAAGEGSVRDAQYDGGYARLLTWTDDSGVTVACARPAEAASLLRHAELYAVGSESCSIGGMAGMLASGKDAACAYFSDVNAAYAVYLPVADTAALQSVLSTMRFTN